MKGSVLSGCRLGTLYSRKRFTYNANQTSANAPTHTNAHTPQTDTATNENVSCQDALHSLSKTFAQIEIGKRKFALSPFKNYFRNCFTASTHHWTANAFVSDDSARP